MFGGLTLCFLRMLPTSMQADAKNLVTSQHLPKLGVALQTWFALSIDWLPIHSRDLTS